MAGNHISSLAPNTLVHQPRKKDLKTRILKYKYLYLMFLPVFLATLIFKYVPMIGIRYAFYKYGPFAPPKFIGWRTSKHCSLIQSLLVL